MLNVLQAMLSLHTVPLLAVTGLHTTPMASVAFVDWMCTVQEQVDKLGCL